MQLLRDNLVCRQQAHRPAYHETDSCRPSGPLPRPSLPRPARPPRPRRPSRARHRLPPPPPPARSSPRPSKVPDSACFCVQCRMWVDWCLWSADWKYSLFASRHRLGNCESSRLFGRGDLRLLWLGQRAKEQHFGVPKMLPLLAFLDSIPVPSGQ
jgi:hypothetical protein